MSRPQRAILIALRSDQTGLQATVDAMEQLARGGFELVGIVDPADHMIALRMVLDGIADVIVSTRPDHMPVLRFAGDAAWFAAKKVPAGAGGHQRQSRPMPRAELVEDSAPGQVDRTGGQVDNGVDSRVDTTPTLPVVTSSRDRRTQLIPRGESQAVARATPIAKRRGQPFRRSA